MRIEQRVRKLETEQAKGSSRLVCVIVHPLPGESREEALRRAKFPRAPGVIYVPMTEDDMNL
jgi:hypothetical protein